MNLIKNRRVALGALIGWTITVALITVFALTQPIPAEFVAWMDGDTSYFRLGQVLGGFLLWMAAVVPLTCVTIIVRLGHLRSSAA